MALVELMLEEAGLPQATLDAVAHLSGVTQVVEVNSSRAVQDALRGSVSLMSTRQSPAGG
jgi:hypothetical protein